MLEGTVKEWIAYMNSSETLPGGLQLYLLALWRVCLPVIFMVVFLR